MNTQQSVKADERTVAVARAANTWALNFISFGAPHRYHVPGRGSKGGCLGLVRLARCKCSHQHGVYGPAQGIGTVVWLEEGDPALILAAVLAIVVAVISAILVRS